jgi:hypothetical protein
MNENTLQTIYDAVKDLTGQTNLAVDKFIRGVNFAVDDYTRQRLLASPRFTPDSTLYGNISRVTVSLGSGVEKLSLPTELITIRQIEVLNDDVYQLVEPTDIQDHSDEPLSTKYSGSGIPEVYDIESNHIYFYPVPSESMTVRMTYQRAHPRFTASDLSLSLGVLSIDEEYLVLYTADYVMLGSSDSAVVAVSQRLAQKRVDIRTMFGNLDQDRAKKMRVTQSNAFKFNSFKR